MPPWGRGGVRGGGGVAGGDVGGGEGDCLRPKPIVNLHFFLLNLKVNDLTKILTQN